MSGFFFFFQTAILQSNDFGNGNEFSIIKSVSMLLARIRVMNQ